MQNYRGQTMCNMRNMQQRMNALWPWIAIFPQKMENSELKALSTAVNSANQKDILTERAA